MEKEGFYDKVYQVCRKIPPGKVTSYGAIARFLGSAQSARMVGWALNASKNIEDVPAHRVVNRNGMLTGKSHFESSHAMRKLLEAEGVPVEGIQVLNFKDHFWDPAENLP